jgi:Ca2+-transporting ATPase
MQAIRECKAAGIRVVMITGDHPVTAKAIAAELGIVDPGIFDGVITGGELEAMTDLELKDAVLQTAVYARVSPEHKLRIVRVWKADGRVVAMTGDGVNDAPGLKEASIGVSMGQTGTEVARQASSMILADDNFATIVAAIKEGRGVHGNIQRTISYLLAGNMAEILVMLGAGLAGMPVPLLPLHLLWINLVTDGMPTLALAAEPVPSDALQHKPSNRLDWKFYRRILAIGAVEAALVLGVYFWALESSDEMSARSMAFSLLVFSELFRSFTSRSDRQTFLAMGPARNWYHLGAVLVPLGLQFAIHMAAPVRTIFRVRALTVEELGLLLGLALIPATLIELRKLIVYSWPKKAAM